MEEVSRRFSNEGFSAPLMLGLPDPFPFSPVFVPAQLIVYFPSANRFERCGVAVDSVSARVMKSLAVRLLAVTLFELLR